VRPAVFLDRDGVLNEVRLEDGVPHPPASMAELEIVAEAHTATKRLREAGFVLLITTNQPDVARGTADRADVEELNEAVRATLGIDHVYCCWHDGSGCGCRKPRPGMLLDSAADVDLDLAASWVVGDRWVDIGAGGSAGTRTILLERSYSWEPSGGITPPADLEPTARVSTLSGAVTLIVRASNRQSS